MTRARLLLFAACLAAGSLAGCRSGGDECDKCSSDDDCRSGFVCSSFDDGSKRCASGLGATNCRTLGGRPARPLVSNRAR